MTTTPTHRVTELAREAAVSLGQLIGQHLKIARLEATAELQAVSRRARLIAVLAALIAVGYGLAMAGLAVAIGGRGAVGVPLVIVGLAHMAGGGAGLAFAPLRRRGSRLLGNTTAALSRSLAALESATAPPSALVSPSPENVHAR
jgi:hypothetical protein